MIQFKAAQPSDHSSEHICGTVAREGATRFARRGHVRLQFCWLLNETGITASDQASIKPGGDCCQLWAVQQLSICALRSLINVPRLLKPSHLIACHLTYDINEPQRILDWSWQPAHRRLDGRYLLDPTACAGTPRAATPSLLSRTASRLTTHSEPQACGCEPGPLWPSHSHLVRRALLRCASARFCMKAVTATLVASRCRMRVHTCASECARLGGKPCQTAAGVASGLVGSNV
jgi:hypothetical protein